MGKSKQAKPEESYSAGGAHAVVKFKIELPNSPPIHALVAKRCPGFFLTISSSSDLRVGTLSIPRSK